MRIVMVICGIIQVIFFSKNENLFAVGIIVLGWFLADFFILTRSNFINYTFSTFLLLGFVITQYAFPLIFTLLEGKPVIYNLKITFEVFTHSILALIILIISHLLYKNWRKTARKYLFNRIQHILYKNHFFYAPSNKQLWYMGFVGIFALAVKAVSVDGGGEVTKFIVGFKIFAYSPLFISLASILYIKNKNINLNMKSNLSITLYIFLLIISGILMNSRGTFIQGITAVGLVFFLGLLIGEFDYKIFKIKYVFGGVLAFWFVTGPLTDVSTAMVIVRGERSVISKMELLKKTIIVFKDKQQINKYLKVSLSDNGGDWSETYFDNIFLARFCNLKFNDANLVNALKLNDKKNQMFDYSVNRIVSTFPTPILNLFNVDVDKKETNSGSFGDFLYSFSGGKNAIGGFRTGHFAGTGMAAFGWWYLVILGIGIIPMFFLLDVFSFTYNINDRPKVVVSLAGLIIITTIFTFLGTSTASESVVSVLNYVLRGWIQSVVLYYFVFKISLSLSKITK
jgi:hypothetical protein